MHYSHRGRFYAYAPYAREIDIWADLFSTVRIASTLTDGTPPKDCDAFTRSNITVLPVADSGGLGIAAKARKLVALPAMMAQLGRYMRSADAIHIRCPSDLGLLGALLSPLFCRYRVAKYAGQWSGYRGEPWTVRLQKVLLRSRWWRSPVTVYGEWPRQPTNIIPFFTSGLSDEHIARARIAASRPRMSETLRILYAGRLSKDKNVDILLEAVEKAGKGKRLECIVAGEGPERPALESQAERLGLRGYVSFTGGLKLDELIEQYEKADVLVLASNSEGWPKAITEAMAFGVVCIGSERGLIPQILGEGRGILVPPRDVAALAAALRRTVEQPAESAKIAARAAEWGQRYSLEGLRDALRSLLIEHWQVPLQGEEKDDRLSGDGQ